MTKIIDLPTTASTDANTFVPVYKNGKTQKVSATTLGGGGSGLDLTSTTDVPAVEGTEYIPLNKPLGTVLRVTVQRILDWILARSNTWTAAQTLSANLTFSGSARRLLGDFTNATVGNRTLVQTSAVNSPTSFGITPNGSGNGSAVWLHGTSDTTNTPIGLFYVNSVEMGIAPSRIGTGSFLPLVFYTGGTLRLTIDASGNILSTGGGVGYGTGSGGTVTQATSKATAVTLNKISGRITTASDALAAGASVSFVVNNNLVANTDGVIVGLNGDITSTNSYEIKFIGSLTGLFVIKITNVSAGSLSNAVQINFQVIKGSIT